MLMLMVMVLMILRMVLMEMLLFLLLLLMMILMRMTLRRKGGRKGGRERVRFDYVITYTTVLSLYSFSLIFFYQNINCPLPLSTISYPKSTPQKTLFWPERLFVGLARSAHSISYCIICTRKSATALILNKEDNSRNPRIAP